MSQEKKPDFVMTADGELVPTDSITSDDLAEIRPKAKELPAFPKISSPAPKAAAAPKPIAAGLPPKRSPAPPTASATPPVLPPEALVELPPPRIAPKPAPMPKRGPPPPPPADPREMVEDRVWTGERTKPDPRATRGTSDVYVSPASARLADDLALPSTPSNPPPPPPAGHALWDEDLSSPAEVEALIRDQKYRVVMEQVADIDGDESLEEAGPTSSQDVPVIRGTAVAPPPRTTAMRPKVSGAGAPEEEPAPRRSPPRVPLNRTIKEKNRNS